ncbi:MAG: NAD(P)H-hydrate dehydratase [Chitinophagaceae bacterium]|nr:NAD(P)H-hydrate dehydratase [Chitinophagaceae bacterium]
MKEITKSNIKSLLKAREENSNKNNYGHALIIAGNKGKMGAAVIAATACLRSGVGLLTVCVPQEERFILQTCIPEAMLIMREDKPYNLHKFMAMCIGPGIGIDDHSKSILIDMMTEFNHPLLLDADALTILSADKKLLDRFPENTIITPHHLEFDRLFGTHTDADDRIETAVKKAKEHHIIIVLKSNKTVIVTPDEIFHNNTTGNSGLAKGGSGDALTGIITSFLAQGYTSLNASIIGVYIHGLAADITLNEQSKESMLITDVIKNLGTAFKSIN